jgi:hypothetical protein
MKKIIYKVLGKQLTGSRFSGTEEVPVEVSQEVPFSEAALDWAKTEALPGSLQIVEDTDPAELENTLAKILLKDRSTGKLFELYVENGKLMMEVM